MTKTQYLDMRGFDPVDWDVLEKDKASLYLEEVGAINNMYPVKEVKAIAAFGKGAYIVKKAWAAKFGKTIADAEATIEEVVQTPAIPIVPDIPPVPLVPTIPAVPEVIKIEIPAVPSIPPVPPVPSTPLVVEENVTEKSEFLLSRIANLETNGWIDDGLTLHGSEDHNRGQTIFYKDLEDMENDEYSKLIMVKSVVTEPEFLCEKFNNTNVACEEQCEDCKPTTLNPESSKIERTPKQLERVKRFNELGFTEDGEEFFRGGISVLTSFILNSEDKAFDLSISNMEAIDKKHAETMNDLEKEKAKETIEKIVEDSGIPKENVIVATVPKKEDIPLNKDGSVDTSEMTEDDAREAIIDHQKAQRDGTSQGKGKLTGTLTATTEKKVKAEIKSSLADRVKTLASYGFDKNVKDKVYICSESKISIGIEVVKTMNAGEFEVALSKLRFDKKEELTKQRNALKAPVETNISLPKANEETMKQFAVIDEVLNSLTMFKWTFYAVESIREIIVSDTTHARKISAIKKLLDNV